MGYKLVLYSMFLFTNRTNYTMNSSDRQKIMNLVLRANNELIDFKTRITTINSTVIPGLRKLKLYTALSEVISTEKELKRQTETLRLFISSRLTYLLEGRVFAELVFKDGKYLAKKKTLTLNPICHFSCSDINRGFVVLNQVYYDKELKKVTGSIILKFIIPTGDIIKVAEFGTVKDETEKSHSFIKLYNIDSVRKFIEQLEDHSVSDLQ